MTTIRYSRLALKRTLLVERFPSGNVEYLLRNTKLATCWSPAGDPMEFELTVVVPDDHWAFTQQEEPKPRFYVPAGSGIHGWKVFDRETGFLMGTFPVHCHAVDYAEFLNNRAKS